MSRPDEIPAQALEHLGWEAYARSLDELPSPGDLVGRVRRVDRGETDVLTSAGEVRAASDSVRAQSELAPVTGDWVEVVDDPESGPRLERILPRQSTIVRRDPAEEVLDQVLAANVDLVGVTAGVDRPLNLARIERFLVLAADGGARPLVVLTKADLGLDSEWDGLAGQLVDVDVLVTSARDGRGLDQLHELIAGGLTLVLLGESGSGKSSLVNALVGEDLLETSQVRAKDAKGRHTTTARELVPVPGGGVLIDTPGIRGVGLWDAGPAVERVYGDIGELARHCRFNDCRHRVEPGCAVRVAVETGELDGARLERYVRLWDEVEEQAQLVEERRRRRQGHPRRRS